MSYCIECEDKLEKFTVMGTITKFTGGLFSNGKLEWENQGLWFCDNLDCRLFGVVVIKAKKYKTPSNNKST